MGWVKRGLIFEPRDHAFAISHAQVPTVLVIGRTLRIYYADRDRRGKSYMTYIDVSAENPQDILHCHELPLLAPGAPGTFDDEGTMPSCALAVGDEIYLYYTGWNQGVTVPYRNAIGLAVSQDGGTTFQRMYEGPIMDRTMEEPYLAVTPFIVREEDHWRMWYISGLRWAEIDGSLEPVYVIKEGSSQDGIRWERPNRSPISQRHELEAFSRPCVLRTEDGYAMWFCARDSRDYRGGAGAYRIGYAVSADGVSWKRDDGFGGLPASAEGWDSMMTCYPYVVVVNGRRLLFYNGNGFGQTGIGYAEWDPA